MPLMNNCPNCGRDSNPVSPVMFHRDLENICTCGLGYFECIYPA